MADLPSEGDSALEVCFRTEGKALPPRPIRLDMPGWAGSADKKMEHGSDPQPWHCRPFAQAATAGLELIYPYERECHVIHEADSPRIEWDYPNEPGGVQGQDKFGFNEPFPPKVYSFATSIDVQVPEGYVLLVQPHPRFFTDATGTVPVAIPGRISTYWWPRKVFVPFKLPPPGGRHIFRKGEPYAQLLVVKQTCKIDLKPMDQAEAARRQELEAGIDFARTQIGKNVWVNPRGGRFGDHYKVLERAFQTDGLSSVEAAIRAGVEKQRQVVPQGLTFLQYMNLAQQYCEAGKFLDAMDVYFFLRQSGHASSPEVADGLGTVAAELGLLDLALAPLSAAVAMNPASAAYSAHLGALLLRMGRAGEAEKHLRHSLTIDGGNSKVLNDLARAVAQQENPTDGASKAEF